MGIINWKILNSREIKDVKKKLIVWLGELPDLNYGFLLNEKNKIYLVSRDIAEVDLSSLRLDRIGLYFAELMESGEIRLSVEGSQLVGPSATQGIYNLNEEQLRTYFIGRDLEVKEKLETQFYLLRYNKDFLGSAKYKNGKLLNFFPKIHRTEELLC